MMNWLQKWYHSQCNGYTEHYYGINIKTIDNPGWSVKIDLNITDTQFENVPWELHELTENNWIGYSIENNVFSGVGDSLKLNAILELFRELIEFGKIKNESVISKLGNVSD